MLEWETAQDVILGTADATGSALEENEAYLNSIEGKINQLSAAFEGLASSTIDSDWIKNIVDMGTEIVTLLDDLGGLIPVLSSIGLGYMAYKLVLADVVKALTTEMAARSANVLAKKMDKAATEAQTLADQKNALITASSTETQRKAALMLSTKAAASKAAALSAVEHASAMEVEAAAAAMSAGAMSAVQIAIGGVIGVISAAIVLYQLWNSEQQKQAEALQQAKDDATAARVATEDLFQSYLDLSIITERTTLEEQKLESALETLTDATYEYKEAVDSLNESLESTLEYVSSNTQAFLEEILSDKISEIATQASDAKDALEALESGNSVIKPSYSLTDLFDKSGREQVHDVLTGAGYESTMQGYVLSGDMYEKLDALEQVMTQLAELELAGELSDYGVKMMSQVSALYDATQLAIEAFENTSDTYDQLTAETLFLQSLLSDGEDNPLTDVINKYQEFMTSDSSVKAGLYADIVDELNELELLTDGDEDVLAYIQLLLSDVYEAMDAWLEYDQVLASLDDTLAGIYDRQAEWEAEQEALEKELELQEKILAVEEAREALAKAKEQRVRIYRAGQGFVYEADWTQLQDAQSEYDQAVADLQKYKEELAFEEEIENIAALREEWESLILDNEPFQEWLASQDYGLDELVDNYEDAFDRIKDIIDDFYAEGNELVSDSDLDLLGVAGTNTDDVTVDDVVSDTTESTSSVGDLITNSLSGTGFLSSMFDKILGTTSDALSSVVSNTTNSTDSISIGSITLPDVTDAASFVDELKSISLKALSFMTSRK